MPTSGPRCDCAPRCCASRAGERPCKGSPPTPGAAAASIGRDLDRWEGHGLEGLADKTAPGNPTRVTEEVKIFMEDKLAEQRTWNATQLAEAVEGRFGIGVGAETIRQHLVAMGYSWKRTRYVPSKPPDPID